MVDRGELDAWFVTEVLALEGKLMGFLRNSCGATADIQDLRQELYARAYDGAAAALPVHTKGYLFRIARNLIIDHARRSRIVSMQMIPTDDDDWAVDPLTPERSLLAREELKRLQEGLQRLPARCREVVSLRKVEGYSQREVARQMRISEHTVERQLVLGMHALADFMLGGSGAVVRKPARSRRARHG